MQINVVCVGTLKEKYWADAIKEYSKRLQAFCEFNIIEVKEGKVCNNESEILETKKQEAKLLEKYKKGYCIALEIKGKSLTSEEFAESIDKLKVQGVSTITFFIGGSNGLDQQFSNSMNLKISFGSFTYPHQLMRVILTEQIYRSFMINNKRAYHK